MTKVKGRDDLLRLVALMGFGVLPGRAQVAPLRTTGWDVSQVISAPRTTPTTLDYLHVQGVDSELDRSGIIHHLPSVCYLLEGRRLTPTKPLPSTPQRILHSVYDINLGEEVYNCHNHDAESEPDLHAMVADQSQPFLMVHWLLTG